MNLTELKNNYDRYLALNYNAKNTIEAYKRCFLKFINENSRIYRMSSIEIENYFISFSEKYSVSYYNQMLTSVNIVFKILNQPFKTKNIPYKEDFVKQVDILSKEELRDTFRSMSNIKHIVIISVLYLGGLRINELLNLKLSDIDFENKRILIKQSKNNITGYIPISNKFCATLQKYLLKHKPLTFLIEGKPGLKYSETSVRKVVKNKIKSNKRVYPHLLRHTCLTHLVDDNHNLFKIQVFARHKTPKSTQRYCHLSENSLQGMTLSLRETA